MKAGISFFWGMSLLQNKQQLSRNNKLGLVMFDDNEVVTAAADMEHVEF